MAGMHFGEAKNNWAKMFDCLGFRQKSVRVQSNQGWAPQPTQAPGYPPPPPPPPAPAGPAGGGSTTLVVITIIVVIIVIIASIGSYFLISGLSGDDNGNNTTPKEALNMFVDQFNSGDIEGAYDSTIFGLGNDYGAFIEAQKIGFGDDLPQLTIEDVSVTESDDMSISERNEAEILIVDIESEYYVEVDDYCLIEYTLTVDYSTEEKTVSGGVICVKVDGTWYLTDGLHAPSAILGAWKMHYMKMTVDGEVTWSNMTHYIMAFYANGTGIINIDDSYYDYCEGFDWEWADTDEITIFSEGSGEDCTFIAHNNTLKLIMQVDTGYSDATVEMVFERYSGTIIFNEEEAVGLAPDFTLPKVNGGFVTLSSLQGRVVVLDFMATWCGPCTAELEHLKEIDNLYSSSEVVILSIDVDSDEDETILSPYISDHGITWSVLMDTSGVSSQPGYDASAIPTLVIIDQDGYIQFRHVGTTDSSILISEIETLL